MLSHIQCASTYGVDAHIIRVETHVAFGLPKYNLVGLPDKAIHESYSRIEAAFKNSGYSFPYGRVTVNLAPADLPKEGSAFDLPIALGLLAASSQVNTDDLANAVVLGELALDGSVRPVRGILPIAVEARDRGHDTLILPAENAAEAGVVEGIRVLGVRTLLDVVDMLNGLTAIPPAHDRCGRASGAATNRYRLRFLGREGSGECETGPGSGRGRRTQHHSGGSARFRQDHDGEASTRHPATFESGRSP